MEKDRQIVEDIIQRAMEEGRKRIAYGEVASYIPELAKADKNQLGFVMNTVDGRRFEFGDCDVRFTMQSVSKVVSLCAALEIYGSDVIFDKVGMEPSGEAFNSLVELDLNSNKPYNPMINSGAIAICSMLLPKLSFYDLLAFTRKLCIDPDISLDEVAYKSEMGTCSRNRAIAYLLESKNIIDTDVEDSLKLYTRLCSMKVTAGSLANLGLILACDGVNPKTGERLLSSKTVQIVKIILLTCGMYDGSGEFAVKVGIPTKSGVGGGLLSVSDSRAGIGIFGPALDSKGNCIAGCEVLKEISRKLRLNIFYDKEWDEANKSE